MFSEQIDELQAYINGQKILITKEFFVSMQNDFRLAIAHEEQIVIQNAQIAALQNDIAVLQNDIATANAELTILRTKNWHEDYLVELTRTKTAEIITLLEALHWIADAAPASTAEAITIQRDLFQSIANNAIDTHPEVWAEWPKEVAETLEKPVEELPAMIEVTIGPMPEQFMAVSDTITAIEIATPIAEELK
jgi:hypothetical protein